MRYLDIAVAALIGASAITALVAWGPGVSDSSAHQDVVRSALRDDLLGFVQARGVVWLMGSTPAEFCAALVGASAPNATLTGTVGGYTCGEPPAGPSSVVLSFSLGGREVVLEAWSNGTG